MAESVIFLRETFVVPRWWFQTLSILIPTWGDDPTLTCAYVSNRLKYQQPNQKQQRTCPVLLVFISHFQNKSVSANGYIGGFGIRF